MKIYFNRMRTIKVIVLQRFERGFCCRKSELQCSVGIVKRILRFDPSQRLNGRDLLMDPFFAALFEPGARRTNGVAVADAITILDLERVG